MTRQRDFVAKKPTIRSAARGPYLSPKFGMRSASPTLTTAQRETMNGVRSDGNKSSLSSPDYDPLIHLNEIFPDPGSLSSLPAIQLLLTTHLQHLDKEIELATRQQREQQSATREQIGELQLELEDLFKNVEAVKGKAEKADGVMGNLTGGIRRLDRGKQNLTISMTALKRLQMLSMSPSCRVKLMLSHCIRTTSRLQ